MQTQTPTPHTPAVAHKTRQFEEWLADVLENFRRHQESLILRMPRIVRDVTLSEFVKYNGDIQAAVKGRNRELLGSSEDATIDFGTRKRKWVESQELEEKLAKGAQEAEGSRGVKNGMRVRCHREIVANRFCSSYGHCYPQEEDFLSACAVDGTEVASPDNEDPSEGTCPSC